LLIGLTPLTAIADDRQRFFVSHRPIDRQCGKIRLALQRQAPGIEGGSADAASPPGDASTTASAACRATGVALTRAPPRNFFGAPDRTTHEKDKDRLAAVFF